MAGWNVHAIRGGREHVSKTSIVELQEAGRYLTQSAAALADYVRAQAEDGCAVHEVEKGIWERVLQLGRWALQHFFACAGDGDVGETIQMPDGRSLRRLAELHRREYGSVFGGLTFGRTVYGSREGQKIVSFRQACVTRLGRFW
jgi:hypothetical protein